MTLAELKSAIRALRYNVFKIGQNRSILGILNAGSTVEGHLEG